MTTLYFLNEADTDSDSIMTLAGQLSDCEKTRCKCPPKCFRDGFKTTSGGCLRCIPNKAGHV